jgi:phytoene dehydrogenase-like protein
MERKDIIIVGGGLAGLTAATILARSGKKVVLIEKASAVGGRARTQNQQGFLFNLGPHALYKHGIAASIYQELSISFSGREPKLDGGFIYSEDRLQAMPLSPLSLLRSPTFTWAEKWEMIRILLRMSKLNPQDLAGQTLERWLAENGRYHKVEQFLQSVFRLTSYCADIELLDAGLALTQFQFSLGGVYYLDGGWQTLVDELVRVAQEFGAEILTDQTVKQVNYEDTFHRIELEGGCQISGDRLILAIAPETVNRLLGLDLQTVPIRLACLDVALRHLPMPQRRFVLGLEQPLYYSVHSAYSALAPQGGSLVHVARYLRHDEDIKSDRIRHELEAFLNFLQPGWQQETVHVRFMPQLVVAHDLPSRKTIASGISNIYLAGDWVGTTGMLSDRAVASAAEVAQEILKATSQESI